MSAQKQVNSYLVALICIAAAIVLALIFVILASDQNPWRALLLQCIPSAIVALLAFPVVYGLLRSRGIRVLSIADPDSDETLPVPASASNAGATVTLGQQFANGSVEPMRRIESEMAKAGTTPVDLIAVDNPATGEVAERDALIVVDIQNDFFEAGSLPVEDTTSLIAPLNVAIALAAQKGALVVLTQDWHPKDHRSFKGHGGSWAIHCVRGTRGAQFHPDLVLPESYETIRFGSDPNTDGYSPFENQEMVRLIASARIREVFVVGIAAEYCVYATCKSAKELGKSVTVIEPLVRAAEPNKLPETWQAYDQCRIRRVQSVPW